MHIISALLISMFVNRDARKKFDGFGFRKSGIPSFRGIIELDHYSPGRIRFRVPKLITEPALAGETESRLPSFPEVESVVTDIRSGSVLVRGSAKMEGGLLVAGVARLMDLEEELERPVKSRLNNGLDSIPRSLDRALYESTNGFLTIKSGLTLFLLISAILKIGRERSLNLPPSFTLLWWLYTMVDGRRGS
jgi:hypothetical protein